MEDAED